jgi:hypothetical protein
VTPFVFIKHRYSLWIPPPKHTPELFVIVEFSRVNVPPLLIHPPKLYLPFLFFMMYWVIVAVFPGWTIMQLSFCCPSIIVLFCWFPMSVIFLLIWIFSLYVQGATFMVSSDFAVSIAFCMVCLGFLV